MRGLLFSLLAALLTSAGIIGVLWCFVSPPPLSVRVGPNVPRAPDANDPRNSIYFGNGCFWHTQYDMVVREQRAAGPFGGRSDASVTSLVGYAGGLFQSPGPRGTACYHGVPGTDYGLLGHSEAVSTQIEPGPNALAQVSDLAHAFFDEGFNTRSCRAEQPHCNAAGERMQRKDPQDAGPMYRNVIGLPGGMDNSTWWPLIVAANTRSMPLVKGDGGPFADKEGEYVVYVYDSIAFPFFRGEGYHQFHENSVIGRAVPVSYTGRLWQVQKALGRLDGHGCMDPPMPSFVSTMLWPVLLVLPLGLGGALAYRLVTVWRQPTPAVSPPAARPARGDKAAATSSRGRAAVPPGEHVGEPDEQT